MEVLRQRAFSWFIAVIAALLLIPLVPFKAAADGGIFETAAGFSYNRSNYSDGNYSWSKRWGGSFGYHFTERSSIEIAFQDVVDRTHIVNYEDTTFHDKIYSINWVQAITGKDFPIQPYLKLGAGQLNREATGDYAGVASPPARVDSLTLVVGAGLRVYLTRYLGLRGELTTYLTGGAIGTYKDNVAFTSGLSLFF